MLIPSIDLMDGKAVQLQQGKNKIIEKDNVLELAKEFSKFGEIAVIDLDAAFDKGDNAKLILNICKIADCRVGGGIRSVEKANEILSYGAKKIIIGTNASPSFLSNFNKEKIIVAIDSKGQNILDYGWKRDTGISYLIKIKDTEKFCSEFLFTDVDKEGMMKGIDKDQIQKVRNLTKNQLTIAGGITSYEDLSFIENLESNSQIGMSIYTGKINLTDAFISVLKFTDSLIPTIVKDQAGHVLMLAYSNKESLRKTFQTNKCTYYSRSRKRLWTKGETSGNTQDLIKARYDCDRDTILFVVEQAGNACHTGKYSCFDDDKFKLSDLYELIKNRGIYPKKGSYTNKLLSDENLILNKIKEESNEVLNYTDKDNLIWEIADLQYFTYALMVKKNISIQDIENELWKRRK